MKALRHLPLAAALFALLGLLWTPHDPDAQNFRALALHGPAGEHWLGVDPLGRDFLSRLWAGAGTTVWLALLAGALALLASALLLALAERFPRTAGAAIGAAVNLAVAVPAMFVGLLLLVFLKPSIPALLLAVALGNLPFAYRQLRVSWKTQRAAQHVEASETLGSAGWFLFRRTLWPNLIPAVSTLARQLVALSALELSGLAFLGLVPNPDFPELGALMRQNQSVLAQAPWLALAPGAVLAGLLMLARRK